MTHFTCSLIYFDYGLNNITQCAYSLSIYIRGSGGLLKKKIPKISFYLAFKGTVVQDDFASVFMDPLYIKLFYYNT